MLRYKIAPLLRVQGVACGRDALFTLLRQWGLLIAPKRRYTKTTVHPSLHTTGGLAALGRAVRGAGRAAKGTIDHSDRAASTPPMPLQRGAPEPGPELFNP